MSLEKMLWRKCRQRNLLLDNMVLENLVLEKLSVRESALEKVSQNRKRWDRLEKFKEAFEKNWRKSRES